MFSLGFLFHHLLLQRDKHRVSLFQFPGRVETIHLLIPDDLFLKHVHLSAATNLLIQTIFDQGLLDDSSGFRHWNARWTDTFGLEIRVRHGIHDDFNFMFNPTFNSLVRHFEFRVDLRQGESGVVPFCRALVPVVLENTLHGLLGGCLQPVIQGGDDGRCRTRVEVDPRWHIGRFREHPLTDVFDFLQQPEPRL